MKKSGHPKYQQVLFVDSSTGHEFVIGSALQTKERGTFQGKEYPMCRVSVSSASHPFFTGSKQLVDAEGRVDKFKKRYSAASQAKVVYVASNDQQGSQQDSHKDGKSKKEEQAKAKSKPAKAKAK
jgi:large subunit ribosomal protein L31